MIPELDPGPHLHPDLPRQGQAHGRCLVKTCAATMSKQTGDMAFYARHSVQPCGVPHSRGSVKPMQGKGTRGAGEGGLMHSFGRGGKAVSEK